MDSKQNSEIGLSCHEISDRMEKMGMFLGFHGVLDQMGKEGISRVLASVSLIFFKLSLIRSSSSLFAALRREKPTTGEVTCIYRMDAPQEHLKLYSACFSRSTLWDPDWTRLVSSARALHE